MENLNGSAFYAAGICYKNNGIISHCNATDITLPSGTENIHFDAGGAGIAGFNTTNGLIEYCNVTNIVYGIGHQSSFAFINEGVIDHCNVNGVKPLEENYSNGVAIYVYSNRSNAVISNCSYSNVAGDIDTTVGNNGMIIN